MVSQAERLKLRHLLAAGSSEKGLGLSGSDRVTGKGADRTELAGCAKLYLPDGRGAPSEQPFGFVLQLIRVEAGLVFVFVAFGPRHPGAGIRSVYERAHRQLHGRFPS